MRKRADGNKIHTCFRIVADVLKRYAAGGFRLHPSVHKLHGFAHADDYYERCSSAQFLPRIRVRTLLIHSEDDPFLPRPAIPYSNMAANPLLQTVITKTGGHVGFIHGSPVMPRFWAEQTAARFLAAALAPTAPAR